MLVLLHWWRDAWFYYCLLVCTKFCFEVFCTKFCFEVFSLTFFIRNFPYNYRGAASGAIKVLGDMGRHISILGESFYFAQGMVWRFIIYSFWRFLLFTIFPLLRYIHSMYYQLCCEEFWNLVFFDNLMVSFVGK